MMPLLEILVCNWHIYMLSEFKLSLEFREHSNGSLLGPAGSLWMHRPAGGATAAENKGPQNLAVN